MHETLCHKIECSSIGSSLFRMDKTLSYVKCMGFTGNFSFMLSMYRSLISFTEYSGGRTGLVVRASDSGSGDPGSILGRVGVLFP